MKIIARERAENCLDGEFAVKYVFDAPWTREMIQALGTLGRLRYYDSFPRPMFHLACPDGSIVKGVQGVGECRVIYARDGSGAAGTHFKERFEAAIDSL